MSIRARLAIVASASVLFSLVVAVQPAAAASDTASDLPGLLSLAAETTSPAYDRDLFEHWIDADSDGCNTRYEVLIEESTTPVDVGSGCSLTNGTWVSPYDGLIATSPAEIEIDHVVALAEAWRSGASAWTDEQRREFANDLDVAYALTAASSVSNQAKSDHDPAEWLPSNGSYTCEYVTGWALMKYRWSLTVDAAELAALQSELSGACGEAVVTLPTVMAVGIPDPDPGQTVITPFPSGSTRLAGADRYSTAIATSQRYAPGVPALFVAAGTNFPDALSAAAAAALLGGPLLITPGDALPPHVLSEVQRLAPKKIFVAGGPNAVGDGVLNALATVAPATRLGGADRFDTSLNIVNTAFTASSHAILASGRGFPDALAATGAAGSRQAPVILVEGSRASLPQPTLDSLTRLGVTSVSIAGGPNAISNGIQSQLTSLGFAVARYGGADRFETSALINRAYFPSGSPTAFVASGLNFPDALAGAALAGRLGAPMFSSMPSCVPAVVHEAANATGASAWVVMGGPNAVGDAVAANLGCLSVGSPGISGNATVGNALTALPGTWTPDTSLSYQWLANGAAIVGATSATLTLTSSHGGQRISVQVTGQKPGYVSGSATSGQTSAVAYPSRTTPIDTWNCPSWAPIKGNANSMIYHVPGGAYYDATNPEECFSTEAAAVAAGYRKSKR